MMLKDLVKMLNTLCAEQWKNILQTLDLYFAVPLWVELFLPLGVVVY